MPTNPVDPDRSARHDQQHQTPGRDAWFQGSRLRLDFNAEAAVQLRDALDRIVRSEPVGAAALARLDVRLPDGRPLRLSVRLTDAGTIRGPDGTFQSSEGVAYVDVSGDLDTHVAARQVIDAATRPYHEVPASEQVAAELDATRVDQALDGRAPAAKALDDQTRDVGRSRATRSGPDARAAGRRRRPSQPGSWDRVGSMTRLERRYQGRGQVRRSRTSGAPAGPLVAALQRNARVWIGSSPHCSSMSASLVGSVCCGGGLLMVASVAAIRAGDAGASVAYYVDEVSRDRHDYYAGHGEAPGVWHGAFAEHLGLPGHVAAEDFRAVLEGRDPTTGEPLKPRANRRVAAWDVTFSPPKSISALWALAPDDARGQVRDAQTAAVDAAIGYLTAHACVARLGRDGVDRQDGSQLGFLRAEFTHRCSREGDPQLHSHSILVNILEAPDGRRAALDGGMLLQHAKAADGIYQAALRAELTQRLGVGWERRDEQWEVAGIPPGLCREWSKRRSQITAALAARGLDPDTASGRAAQTAALATRHAKVQVGDGRSLHDRFAREAIVAGHDPGYILQAALHAGVQQGPPHGSRVTRLLDAMTGPDGVTKQASSFSRRDAIIDLAGRSAIHGAGADNAAARVEILVNRLLRDDRVVPVLAPAARTTSELLRVRDATGRIIRTVDQPERRYTTVDLLAAETELLGRATRRQNAGVARIPRRIVDQVLAAHPGLDSDQESMVRTLASSGAGVDVVVGKAGTGKSTALGAYRAAMDAAGIRVVGVAPSATAAHQLAMSAGITDTATVDRLLTELRHGRRALPHGVVVVLDEAAMCPTRTRLALQRAVDAVDGKVVDVGDHRQIPSVDVGGGHYALAQRLGATVLGHNHRFRDPVYRDAAELLRDRQPAAAVGVLRAQGAVSDHYTQPVDAWAEMVDDWLTHRDNGHSVLMLATERATVGELNRLARAHLIARGAITRRSRTYRVPDDRRTITLAVGDEVILRRNQRLTQPDGTTIAVRNGMTGRVTATRRRGASVELDAAHHPPGGPKSVTLPAGYVGAHVDYGYARTVDTAQGATVDHSLFAPSASATAERAYVALSRGRLTNRIYTTRDRAWIDAIGRRRGHALAVDQQPAVDRSPRHVMRPRTLARDHDRQPPLEVGL